MAFVLLSLIAWADDARADGPEESYQLAYSRYKNGLYEDAADIFRKLLAIKIDPEKEDERAKVYRKARPVFVACLFGIAAVSEETQAAALIREADASIIAQYRQDPFFKLPTGYAQEVSDRWTRVYFEHKDELDALKEKRIAEQQAAADLAAERERLERERTEQLEELAKWENFVRTRSRVVAAIPLGVGQFQNDDIGWGVFFAISESIFITGAIASWAVAEDVKNTQCPDVQRDDLTGELKTVDCGVLTTNFEIARAINYSSLATAGALIIGGIIHAQVVFEPERKSRRPRPLPKVRVTPTAFASPDGGFVGLSGTF